MTLNEEFETIKEFAETNKDMFPDGGNVLFFRSKKYKYFSDEHLSVLKDKFVNSRNFGNKDVATIPDNVFILIKKFDKNDEEIKIIKDITTEYGVEDLIGHRLEEYIYS